MPKPMGRQTNEKSKDFVGSMKRLLKNLKTWNVILIISIMLAMMLVPFMSCTARLPIYAIFVAAFFSDNGGNVLLAIYLLGIVVALVVAAILKRTMFKGLSTPFVMELPTYKVPSVKGALLHTWEKVKGFLRKAGTIILVCSIILWALQNIYPWGGNDPQMSLLGMIGTTIAPIFAPLGFGTWQAAVAILAGLSAKEVVVSTFGTLAGMEGDDEAGITHLIQNSFTPLSGFSFMALLCFILHVLQPLLL